ncbi:hypothetical protein NKOR_00595 [Candidatus Nitrosopumilus koreensis AR1]|uniref:Uncharacterized protein n=2 Tax=Nitrosopumilus TaxID=338191 RepID=K0B4H9_9ARCH|nr:hypothetical protein [Candidatus Nitrosopumilus koreensis]AFS80037.1 hypothetical protein NKOR_00595 [Candidatus Nitrosopumilus koreensis AR1]
MQRELHGLLTGVETEKNEIILSYGSMIWTFYNRFFPVKIIVRTLANLITSTNKIWFSLDELREKSFEYAERVSDQLKAYEDENELGRNEKLSTGLPLPKSETKNLKGVKKKKKLDKIAASELRFKEQFVGRFLKKDLDFKGACFELGLVRAKINDDGCFLTLSDLGKEFAILENPILDEDRFDSNFSNEEVKLIRKQIISKFDFENKVVKRIMKELETKKMSSDELDDVFKEEWIEYLRIHNPDEADKVYSVTSERVATMGRLAELKLVKWDIISGKSEYSIVK